MENYEVNIKKKFCHRYQPFRNHCHAFQRNSRIILLHNQILYTSIVLFTDIANDTCVHVNSKITQQTRKEGSFEKVLELDPLHGLTRDK